MTLAQPASSRGKVTAWLYACVALLLAWGVWVSYAKGARDFLVFYHAWLRVLEGDPMGIYYNANADVFLYAPGFAWLLAPLGKLSIPAALGVWSVAKLWAVGAMIRVLIRRAGPIAAAVGVLIFARVLLIDFQYGQVNLLIAATCVWALDRYAEPETTRIEMFCSWFFLAIAAFAKLYPGLLLLIPFFPGAKVPSGRRKQAMAGAVLGSVLILVLPFLSLDLESFVALLLTWKNALLNKGFPTDSHNQSFMAFLTHTLTDTPIHVISRYDFVVFGLPVFSAGVVRVLGAIWAAATAGVMLFTAFRYSRGPRFLGLATLVAVMILPSHLVWKPYFLVGIPLAAAAASIAQEDKRRRGWIFLGVIGVLMNCTSIDFVGAKVASHFEAYSTMLWCLLALMGWTWWRQGSRPPLS